MQQAIANGQVDGRTQGPDRGIGMASSSAYQSVAAVRAAAEPRARYDDTRAPLDIGSSRERRVYDDPRSRLDDNDNNAGYQPVSVADAARMAAEENPAPKTGAASGAIELRDRTADEPVDEDETSEEPADGNGPVAAEAPVKEATYRSAWCWGTTIVLLVAILMTVFLLGAFRFRWFASDAAAPKAVDVDEADLPAGKAFTVRIADHVIAGDNPVDFTSVVLLRGNPDAPEELPSLDIDEEGTWSVDRTSGDITFTPDSALVQDPATVSWRISDSAGAVSNTATVTLRFAGLKAPRAGTIVRSGLPAGQPVTITVADHVTPGDRSVDFSTVVLLDAGAETTSLAVDGDGTWSVDAASGDITFAPQTTPAPTANPAPVSWRVKDSAGAVSNTATIRLAFEGLTGGSVTDMQGPEVSDIALVDQPAGTVLTFDVPSHVLPGTDPVDFTTVVLIGAPADRKKLVVPDKGTWEVDRTTGRITFTPLRGIAEDPRPLRYQVSDRVGRVSNVGYLTAGYTGLVAAPLPRPPITEDAIRRDYEVEPGSRPPKVAPVTFNMKRHVTRGADDIDWSTLRISPRVPVPGDRPDGLTSFEVGQGDDREGTWELDVAASTVTFTPFYKSDRGFTGSPTPIAYWVEDVKGLRSPTALIIANKHLGEIAAAIDLMAQKTDADFWADYKSELIDANVDLQVIYGLTYQIQVGIRAVISTKGLHEARGDGRNPSDNGYKVEGLVYTDALAEWTDGSAAQMYAVAERTVEDHLQGVGGLDPLARRLIQVDLIMRLLRDQFITREMMRKAGGGT